MKVKVEAVIHIHHYEHGTVAVHQEMMRKLDALLVQGGRLMATQQEMVVQINGLKDQVAKIGTETSTLITKVNDLLAIIAAGPVTPELQAAVDSLKAQVQVVDDLVPDPVPPTP